MHSVLCTPSRPRQILLKKSLQVAQKYLKKLLKSCSNFKKLLKCCSIFKKLLPKLILKVALHIFSTKVTISMF